MRLGASFGIIVVLWSGFAWADAGPDPAMSWLHEGSLLTLRWSVMSHAGQGVGFKLDQQGNWEGTDGTKMDAYNRPSGSASGVTQINVTCIDKGQALLISHAFADMQLMGFPDPLALGQPTTFYVPLDGQVDLWWTPAKLAAIKPFDAVTKAVAQNVQWPVGGRQVDAIRVTSADENHWMDHVYDRNSGMCLHAAESITGAAPELKYLAPGDTRAGDTLLSVVDFMSQRNQHTPWATEPMPQWCGQFKVLHYSGSSARPNSPFGGAPAQLGLDVSYRMSGANWLAVDTSGWMMIRGQPSPPQKGVILCGHNQYDSFFAGPAALAKLQQNQVLDDDPITRVKTEVTGADGQTVTITSSSAGIMVSHTFDVQTGKLRSSSTTDRLSKIVTTFQLQSEE